MFELTSERGGFAGPGFAAMAGLNYQTFAMWRSQVSRAW